MNDLEVAQLLKLLREAITILKDIRDGVDRIFVYLPGDENEERS